MIPGKFAFNTIIAVLSMNSSEGAECPPDQCGNRERFEDTVHLDGAQFWSGDPPLIIYRNGSSDCVSS